MCLAEGLRMSHEELATLVTYYKGDIRKSILNIQVCVSYSLIVKQSCSNSLFKFYSKVLGNTGLSQKLQDSQALLI